MGRRCAKGTKKKIGCVIAALLILSFLACVPARSFHSTKVEPGYEQQERLLLQRSSDEQRLVEEQRPVYEDDQLEHYLTQVARSLQPPEVLARVPFRVKVLRDASADALSFPDGRIYLTTAMVARLENEAQLAVVLAHEMTHCTHQHALRALRHVSEEALGRKGLSGAESALAWHRALPRLEAYIEELEREADAVGLHLVVQAGYDATEGGKLLGRQQRDLEEEGLVDASRLTRYRDLGEREKVWRMMLQTITGGAEPRIVRRETFLARAYRVILDGAFVEETRGRFTLAEREVESCLAIRPDDAKAYYLLGEICRQRGLTGDREKAKDCYTRAIDLQPSFPEPYRGLGILSYKEGEKIRAKNCFEAYLIYAPDAPDKAYIQRYIATCGQGN
jgi:tetratricopeptide (TPR) repeat protein